MLNKTVDKVFKNVKGPIVVGLSGGPDSMALLHVMVELGLEPIAGYYNHNLREDSNQEADFVQDYTESKKIDKAELCYRQGLTLDPGNPSRMYGLAWLLVDKDINVNEGLDLIQKALELEPDNWYYLDTKGWGLYKQGRYEEALKLLNDSWDLRPSYRHRGYLHIREGEKALANQNQ